MPTVRRPGPTTFTEHWRAKVIANLNGQEIKIVKVSGLKNKAPDAWIFGQHDDLLQPVWDSGVRKALKLAANAEECVFPGFGPHSLRRANITWRQEVGGSSIEPSQIAGHSNTRITEQYTVVQLKRQDDLTRRIQGKRSKAGKRNRERIVEITRSGAAA